MSDLNITKTNVNKKEENKVEKYIARVNNNIFAIINWTEYKTFQWHEKSPEIFNKLNTNFKKLLESFLKDPNFSHLFPEFFNDNWEINKKFTKKFDRYFPIYKDFLIEKIKQNPWEEKKIIIDFVKTLFIFEENLEVEKFWKFFLNNTSEQINELFQESKKLFSSFTKVEYENLENSEHNFDKENKNAWLMMIKNHLSDWIDENGKFNKLNIQDSIHSHFEKTAEKFIETFDHWYRSTNLDKEFLFILKNSLNNLEKDFQTLKDSWYWDLCKKDFIWYLSDKLDKSKYDKNFIDLITKLINSKSDNLSEKVEEIIEILSNNRNKYLKNYIRKYRSLENKSLETVSLDDWYEGAWFERRSKFFGDVFVEDENWNMKFIDRYLGFLWIKPNNEWYFDINNLLYGWDQRKKFEKYLMLEKNFWRQKKSLRWETDDEKFRFYIEDTIEQFKDILRRFQNKSYNNKQEEVLTFIEEEKNSVDLLVWFWWESLENEEKEKTFNKNRDEKMGEKYPSHGIKEWIITRLNTKWLLDNEWAQILLAKEWEKPTNSSVWNKTAVLYNFFHWYKEWYINLSDFEIWSKKMKDIIDLYIPARTNNSDTISIKSINDFLELGLDTCSSLLEWKTIKQSNYIDIINRLWFDIKNKKQIQNLKEFLKYLKFLIPSLEWMMNDAEKDKKDLKEIKDLFPESKKDLADRFIIWPDKEADRWFIKLVSKYNWDARSMWDLTRWMIISDNVINITNDIWEFIEVIKYHPSVEQINISESTWNFTEKAPKASWYRDVVLEVKMKSWNKVEIQFHYKEYLKFKKNWYILWKDFLKKEFINNPKKFIKFTDFEVNKILDEAQRNYKWIKLPENFWILCENPNHFNDKVNWEKVHKSWNLEDNSNNNKLSSDTLYNLARAMEKDEDPKVKVLVAKLRKIESIWYDIAWGKTLANELRESWETEKNQKKTNS